MYKISNAVEAVAPALKGTAVKAATRAMTPQERVADIEIERISSLAATGQQQQDMGCLKVLRERLIQQQMQGCDF